MSPDKWPSDAVPPLLVFLASDQASDINGQVFSCGADSVGWYEPTAVAREVRMQTGRLGFSFDELAARVPAELLAGVPPAAPWGASR